MAPPTPRFTAGAAAVTTGLLALTCAPAAATRATALAGDGAAPTRAASVPAPRTAPDAAPALRATASVPAPRTAPDAAPATSSRAGAPLSAAQRVRLAGLVNDEDALRRTSGTATTSSDLRTVLQRSLSAARKVKPTVVPAPSLAPSPTPSPSATAAPAPAPAPAPPAPAPAPTVTTAPAPAPAPTVTTAPAPAPTVTTAPAPAPTPTVTAPAPTPTVTVSPTSAPTPTPTSTLSPSGVSAPRGDLTGWKQTYAEDFGKPVATGGFPGTAYGTNWGVYDDGWKDTSRNGTYMPSKVLSVHDGVLDYHVRTENGVHMVSAPWVKTTAGQTYGRYSVRFRADALPGYKTAWLLWPDSERWPDDGEIDFPEGNLGAGDTIEAFHHYAQASGGQDAFRTGKTFAQWHTATVEWSPGKVVFLLDDVVVGTSTKLVPTTAMHWVLQTETNLDGYAPADSVAGHVYVDWVATWTRA